MQHGKESFANRKPQKIQKPRFAKKHSNQCPVGPKKILWTQNQDFGTRIWYFLFKKHENWYEMDPYGSVGAHITTGKSPMAHDHVETPPDLKKGHGMTKNLQKT